MKKIKLTFTALLAMMFFSCDDFNTDLEVPYVENPTREQLGTESTANKLFHNWYNTVDNYNGPGLMLATMADQITMSWGNQGMRDMSSEPRIAWNNSSTYSYAVATEAYFNSLHAILADANAIVVGLEGDIEFSDPDKYESVARFGQGASVGYLALMFDQVWLSDATGVLNEGQSVPYHDAVTFALDKLDLAIAAADRGDFELGDNFVYGKTYTSDQWSEFLNTLAARILVNSRRYDGDYGNYSESEFWTKVLAYTQEGLTYNFAVGQDGWIDWWPDFIGYSIYPGWGRVDMRLIGMMDESYPQYWPAGETTLPEASSPDARLETDFEYLSSQDFPADRGTYHWSTYRHARYDQWLASGFTTDLYDMLKAENDLYMAEAYLHLGNLEQAAAVLNSSSRVVRGELPPVAVDAAAIEAAIHYETMIELMNTGMGLGFFEMRSEDLLQEGTPLHLPVPGAALDAAGIPIYTFGGTQGTPGEDYSTGGWR